MTQKSLAKLWNEYEDKYAAVEAPAETFHDFVRGYPGVEYADVRIDHFMEHEYNFDVDKVEAGRQAARQVAALFDDYCFIKWHAPSREIGTFFEFVAARNSRITQDEILTASQETPK